METINFNEFIAPEIQNKRKSGSLPPKVQEFDALKYRKAKSEKGGVTSIQGQFYIAKAMFTSLGIETNALRHFIHPTDKSTVLLGTVADDDGKFMKKRKEREKGDAFKSEALEAALAAAGIIDTSAGAIGINQFIDIIPVGTSLQIPVNSEKKITVFQAFKLAKGVAKKKEVAAPVAAETAAPAKAEAKAPVAEAAPVAAAGDDQDWN
jgi:hypothetical protein